MRGDSNAQNNRLAHGNEWLANQASVIENAYPNPSSALVAELGISTLQYIRFEPLSQSAAQLMQVLHRQAVKLGREIPGFELPKVD